MRAIPPVCARASTMSTPGMMGRAGKWPWKNSSFMLTLLMPTAYSPGTYSLTLSTRRKGYLCGIVAMTSLTSIVFGSAAGVSAVASALVTTVSTLARVVHRLPRLQWQTPAQRPQRLETCAADDHDPVACLDQERVPTVVRDGVNDVRLAPPEGPARGVTTGSVCEAATAAIVWTRVLGKRTAVPARGASATISSCRRCYSCCC
mmetsp:Transcript_4519/g.16199  ORF Transcript_4519/g.16199 Transcript_4519/m.16199 type:complete len:204 (-) Transcript_4519:37-648(-)